MRDSLGGLKVKLAHVPALEGIDCFWKLWCSSVGLQTITLADTYQFLLCSRNAKHATSPLPEMSIEKWPLPPVSPLGSKTLGLRT